VNSGRYFRDRIDELRSLAKRGDPWVFLCASAFIEYLAKISQGKTPSGYKQFLTQYFFKVCPEYASFRYHSGKSDLAEQMYHVLRCGIVHSFSLIADPTAKSRGGRDRSILLAHRQSGAKHLGNLVDRHRNPKLDAAIFVAEDFVEDIAKVSDFIFVEARKRTAQGEQLRSNIRTWVHAYPPLRTLSGQNQKGILLSQGKPSASAE